MAMNEGDAQDLLAAWRGQVHALDDRPKTDANDESSDLLAQLRTIADDLARPPQTHPARLLTAGDRELPTSLETDRDDVFVSRGERTRDIGAPPLFDEAAVLQSIEESERRIHSVVTKSHDRLAEAIAQAFADSVDRRGPETDQALEETRRQLEDARHRLDEENVIALRRAIGMLSVLESLDDVVASFSKQADDGSMAHVRELERQKREIARLVELEEISTDGAVDPHRHEIVSAIDAVDTPFGQDGRTTIVDVRQPGYAFRGRVVRPAQVVVAI